MHRNERFPTQFLQNIEHLLDILTDYICNTQKEKPFETSEVNKSVAHFLKVSLVIV